MKEKTKREQKEKKEKKNERVKCTSIGGQAVMEGVMMRGERSMALAVRDSEGKIRLETTRFKSVKSRGFWFNFPIIRGVVRFGQTLADGVKTLMRSADVYGEAEPGRFEKWLSRTFKVDLMSVVTFLSVLLGVAFAIFLYSFLPNAIAKGLRALIGFNDTWEQVAIAVSKFAILIGYLLLCSLLKDIRRTFMYHGAEHRTINCYEKGLEMTVENIQTCTTLNKRCGTTFLFYTLLVSVIVSFFVGIQDNLFLQVGIRILLILPVAGISYELLKLLAKTDFWLFYPLQLPGMLLQKITTKKPTDDMAEVALTAFNAVLEMDADESIPTQTFEMSRPRKEAYEWAQKELEGIADPADVDWMFCAALKTTRAKLPLREKITPTEYAHIRAMVEERKTGKPLQYILANTNFCGFELDLTPDVLIPRFETELLVEQALKVITSQSRVLDLCTGSGCIAVAVQKKSGAAVTASDLSEAALALAAKNAEKNGAAVTFVQSDLFEKLEGPFDVIISNPPYVRRAEIPTLSPEVQFEPVMALDGGEDGLDFYRRIAAEAPAHLTEKGALFLEVGEGQAREVESLLREEFEVKILKDYDGVERMIRALRREKN